MPTRFFLLGPALCAAAALAGAASAADADCGEIDAEITRADEARRAAQLQKDEAWKAVVPFVVLARKAAAASALADADRRLAELKAQAARCEPGDGR